jgi:opacity protein-like surface antigen
MFNSTLKRLLLGSVSLVLNSSNLFANGAVPCPIQEAPIVCEGCHCPATSQFYKSGFYGGLQVGLQGMRTKMINSHLTAAGVVDGTGRKEKTKTGFIGDMFVGVRVVLNNCWVTGLEVGGVINTNETNQNLTLKLTGVPNRHFHVKAKREYGIIPSLMVGHIFWDRHMAYMRAGIAFSHFKSKAHDVELSNNYDKASTKIGIAPVAGLEFAFSSSMSARLEVGAEFYGKLKKQLKLKAGDYIRTKNRSNLYHAKIGVVVKI